MQKPKVHFIGIGGIGMSALARWFLSQGWAVSGSDLERSATTSELQKEGIKIKIGHRDSNVPKDALLAIYNQAITHKNGEFRAVKKRGIPLLSYPQAIGSLTKKYETISVSGAHGKSTTTALLSVILLKTKLDPTIIIGTKLRELKGSNFHHGKSPYLLLEADEWKAAFLNYTPSIAIITNIDREHLDFYKNLPTVKKTFLKFIHNIKHGGTLIVNHDDRNLRSLKQKINAVAKKNKIKVVWYSLQHQSIKKIKKVIQIPGVHNLQNALAAVLAAREIGISEHNSLAALRAYRGAWRRMEYRGKHKRALVYDDYGHHPTEIKATLAAFREKYEKDALVCVFQPHQAERLKLLFKEFMGAFKDADITLIPPLYQVAGRDEKASSKYDSEALVKTIQKREPKKKIFYLANMKNLKKALDALLPRHGRAVIVMMGAGNIVKHTDSLVS